MQQEKYYIFRKLKDKGAFWSYDFPEHSLPDDAVLMEKGLLYLEFEDMHLLFDIYGSRRLKEFWRSHIVSQGSYYHTINWLLAVLFFNIKNPDKYLKRYGKHN